MAEYYVATNGDDGASGDIDHPWQTLARTIEGASSGDTVYFYSGTWQDERLYIAYKPYTSPTTFARFPNDPIGSVIFDGTNLSPFQWEDAPILIRGTNHVKINGIKIQNFTKYGICVVTSEYTDLTNNFTETTGQAGIILHYAHHCNVQHNKIHCPNMTTIGNGLDEMISIASASTNIDVSYNECYAGNRALSATGGEGPAVKDGCSYIYMHHNYVDQSRPDGQESDRYCMGTDGWDGGNGETHHLYYYNNILKNGSWGLECNAEEGGYAHHVYHYNNIIVNCGHSNNMHGGAMGFPRYGGSPGICDYVYWWNNTAYNCYYGFFGDKEELGTGENYVQNNIFYGITQADIHWGGSNPNDLKFDHNLWSDVDPKFIDAANDDFHLMPDSPAIDAGVTLADVANDHDDVTRPQGGGYDIGAYEYNDGVPPPPPPPPSPGNIESNPPMGGCVITNIYFDPNTGKMVVEYDDIPVS